MNRRPVEIVEWRESLAITPSLDTFRYRPERGYCWLQRLCIGALRRLRCNDDQVTTSTYVHRIQPNSIVEAILKSEEIAYEMTKQMPTKVYIGGEDYQKFTKNEVPRLPFDVAETYCAKRQIYGLTVVVVPWMRGVMVPPRGK